MLMCSILPCLYHEIAIDSKHLWSRPQLRPSTTRALLQLKQQI